MNSRRIVVVASALFLLILPVSSMEQDLDGPTHIFNDSLLENMVGTWNLTGKVLGRPANHSVQAEWVLNHQFLRIYEKDKNSATNVTVPYEAIIMIGYDNASERYVVHWTDIYGGRFSETLGYGARAGNEIRLVFEYPDGPFHTTFRWLPETNQWTWRMRSRDKTGKWADFAELALARANK
jgi:Protein of unknown function (DUF1579)